MAQTIDIIGKMLISLIALVQLHLLLICGKKQSVQAMKISSRHAYETATKICPFKATQEFFGRVTLLYNNLGLSFTSPHDQKIRSFRDKTQAMSFLTSKQILLNINLAKFNTYPPRQIKTALYAATVDDVQTHAENNSKNNKKKNSGNLEVVVLGLSHHNARVEVREKLAIPEDDWNTASNALCEYPSISEATILSTCNRFEIYLAGPNQYECIRDAIDFLIKRTGGSLDQATLRYILVYKTA